MKGLRGPKRYIFLYSLSGIKLSSFYVKNSITFVSLGFYNIRLSFIYKLFFKSIPTQSIHTTLLNNSQILNSFIFDKLLKYRERR